MFMEGRYDNIMMSELTDQVMNTLFKSLTGKLEFFPAKHDNNEMTFMFENKGFMIRVLPFELPKELQK